jgi:type II secretory ATPase GspE/PulE/Tfp pilus assembly ATPase PilB-like protein
LEKAIEKPTGMILMCGPTGSGKTTTLYAILNQIDRFTRNVITVEDPIECIMPNTSQIEVNAKADITFAKALRSMLRQDPDVICVGEIRDEETAGIALRAAQTGHLVLATVHCNSNASAMIRLLDLGTSPLLMASGLSVLVSQRLLRMLCPKCKRPAHLDQSQIEEFTREGINYRTIHGPVGCSYCHDTGYLGRVGVYDILVLDDAIKSKISKSEMLINEIRRNGEKKGISNLRSQAMKKVLLGVTTIEEVNRVIGGEE